MPLTPGLLALAVLLSAAEIGFGLLFGFLESRRAEALLFIALRPWIMLAAALVVARRPARLRAAFYLLLMLFAATAETLLVLALGASDPWREMLLGMAAGALLVLIVDLVLQLGRRLWRWGHIAAALAMLFLFLTPLALDPYARIVAPEPRGAPRERAPLLLMTALPIIWGEGGAFDPESRPAASFLALEREFEVRPLDVLDEGSLRAGGLLLLAQPRALAPEELVALDAWLRRGGRALILTDPALLWPSELPLGDPRRPPAVGLLAPLLDHWGLSLEPPRRSGLTDVKTGDRKLRMASPGRIRSRGTGCTLAMDGLVADCALGSGRALVLADADLMHDATWTGGGEIGAGRNGRLADNPLVVADLLDRLQGWQRQRVAGDVQWADPGADPSKALLAAMLPLLLGIGATLLLRAKARR